jgi:hypothetical protein
MRENARETKRDEVKLVPTSGTGRCGL